MGSKLIFLLGLFVGGLLMFFCINKDKRELLLNYKNIYLNDTKKVTNLKQEPKSLPILTERQGLSPKKIDERNNNIDTVLVDREEQKKIINIEEEITTLLKKSPIYFETSSSEIRQDSKDGLNILFTSLKNLPKGTIVTVAGYTDAIGNASFNKKLSQKRADSVKFYLKKGGLNHLIIKAKGYGEEQSLVSNLNDKKKRRVEIHLEKGK